MRAFEVGRMSDWRRAEDVEKREREVIAGWKVEMPRYGYLGMS